MSTGDKLPHVDEAYVESAKLADYLLSSTHPDGKGKAEFFIAFGFSASEIEQMKTALVLHGLERSVVQVLGTEHGVKYVVECSIVTPDARNPCVRSVWIVDTAKTAPRFVTAYPNQV